MKNYNFILPLLLTAALPGFASDFIGASGSDYNVGTNWNPTGVPTGGSDDARINTGDFAVVNSVVSDVADDIVVLNGGRLDITGGSVSGDNRLLLRDASTVNHSAGTLTIPNFQVGTQASSTGSTYNLSGTGEIAAPSLLSVGFQSGTEAVFSITGSNAIINTGTFEVKNGGTQKFVFDASGLSTINATGAIGLVNAAATDSFLDIDFSAFSFSGDTSFTLINAGSGLGASETFGTTAFTYGGNASVFSAAIEYDTVNHDVKVNLVTIPEPSTFLLLSLSLGGFILLFRRR